MWNPESTDMESESTAWNPESKTLLDYLTWGDACFTNFIIVLLMCSPQVIPVPRTDVEELNFCREINRWNFKLFFLEQVQPKVCLSEMKENRFFS